MTAPDTPATTASDATAPSLERTVRIEHDRRRLLQQLLASSIALLAACGALVVAVLRAGGPAFQLSHAPEMDALVRPYVTALPWWTCTLLALAVVSALIGTLRNVFRLQDGDPALVISPRGLSFRPSIFGEIVRIPWTAIRGFRLRRYKQNRFLALQVEEPDRYVANVGPFASLARAFGFGTRANEIRLATPMGKRVAAETEAVLRRYLAHYGKTIAASDGARTTPANDGNSTRARRGRAFD